MDKKEIKQLLDAQTKELVKETERHERVILEEFEHRLTVVAEVQVEHTKKFTSIERKLDAVMEMTALNTENIEMMKGMLKRKVDLDEYEKLEKRVGVLEKKLHLSGV